jgi:hypothetical protein
MCAAGVGPQGATRADTPAVRGRPGAHHAMPLASAQSGALVRQVSIGAGPHHRGAGKGRKSGYIDAILAGDYRDARAPFRPE